MTTEFILLQNEWIQIGPLGDHGHEMGIQRIDPAAAATMVRAFNSFGSRLGRLFSGAPVFEGHHDTNPDRYPNGRSFGWVMELQDRAEQGIWGRVKWSEHGVELLKNGNYKFVSPVWEAREISRENGKIVYRPEKLLSLALTNMPNLPLLPLANERQSMKTLIEILELKGEPTGEEICAAAETLANARGAETQRAATLANELIELKKLVDAERAARRDLVLSNAILRGRITLAEKDRWLSELTADFDKAEKELATGAPVLNQTSQTELLGNNKPLYETAESRRIFINSFMLEKMSAGMTHMAAWELAKSTHPHLFEKMQPTK